MSPLSNLNSACRVGFLEIVRSSLSSKELFLPLVDDLPSLLASSPIFPFLFPFLSICVVLHIDPIRSRPKFAQMRLPHSSRCSTPAFLFQTRQHRPTSLSFVPGPSCLRLLSDSFTFFSPFIFLFHIPQPSALARLAMVFVSKYIMGFRVPSG